MHMTTIDQVLHQPWSDETHTWVRNCARELHVIFDTMGWTWSGQPVTEDDLANKIIGLCVQVTDTLETTGRDQATIDSGRIRVEGRRPSTDNGNISLWVYLCAYIPGDSKQFDV